VDITVKWSLHVYITLKLWINLQKYTYLNVKSEVFPVLNKLNMKTYGGVDV
jgi:hypothetical protein